MKFLNYIHNFRGVAILCIVFGHCVSAFDWSDSPLMEQILTILLGNGTVLFVFIAGYLFQHLIDRYEFKDYFVKKLQYVILPYLICSIPAILFFVFFQQRWNVAAGFYGRPWYAQIVMFYLTGAHLAPYWFIPMIFMYYLASPVLAWIDRHPQIYYSLPVFVVVSLLIPRAGAGAVFQNFAHFFSVYLFGMLCSHYRAQIIEIIARRESLIMMAVAVLGLSVLDFYTTGHHAAYLQKLVFSALFLALLYKFDARIKQTFSLLATTSFGIYFAHSYIISTLKMVYANRTGHYFHGGMLPFLLLGIFASAASLGVVALIQTVFKKHSRYIIGS